MYASPIRPLVLLLLLLAATSAAACTARDRQADPWECGQPGSSTVVVDGGCFCLAGYVLREDGRGCVPDASSMLDAGTPQDAASGDGGTPEPDAGALPGTMREVDTSHGNCEAGCSAIGFPCTTSCEEGPGRASFGYYDWDYGLYRSVHTEALSSCTEEPAASHEQDGTSYDLGRVVCCCAIPEVTRVRADLTGGLTCAETCRAEGLECAGFFAWPSDEGTGGTFATYYRPETGSVTYQVYGCDAVPRAEREIAGAIRQLREYDCACY